MYVCYAAPISMNGDGDFIAITDIHAGGTPGKSQFIFYTDYQRKDLKNTAL